MVRVLLKWRYPFQPPEGAKAAVVSASWSQQTERETYGHGRDGGAEESQQRERRRREEEEREEEEREEVQRPVAKPRVKVRRVRT